MRVPLLPDRPQGEAIQLCRFHQASAVLLIPAALLPVDDRDRDIFAMLKIITQKKRPTIEDIYLTGSGTSLMPLPIFLYMHFLLYMCQFLYIFTPNHFYIYAV